MWLGTAGEGGSPQAMGVELLTPHRNIHRLFILVKGIYHNVPI